MVVTIEMPDELSSVSESKLPRVEQLTFRALSFSVRTTKEGKPSPLWAPKSSLVAKPLLRDCSASIAGGEIVAVLGPSGAGKTTLLSLLTLQATGGQPSGRILLNGHPFTKRLFSRYAVSLPQDDRCWALLSCREHVAFAVDLYQAAESAAARAASVSALLSDLGLESCAETIAGNELIKGLSGGQRRRLTLALALAKRPSVVFLDEPTSGLDASGAAEIVRQLRLAASRLGAPVLCTIHQPSATVFEGFDKALVLSGGRLAYYGATTALSAYLGSIGKPVPSGHSAAEYVLELCNKDFTSGSAVDEVLDAWAARRDQERPLVPSESPLPTAHSTVQLPWQVAVLLRKHVWLAVKDPMLYTARVVIMLFNGTFFPCVYNRTRQLVQDQVVNRFFLLFWIVTLPGIAATSIVYVYNVYAQSIRLEVYAENELLRPSSTLFEQLLPHSVRAFLQVRSGMYSPLAFVLTTLVIELPIMFVHALALLLPAFAIGNWHFEAFVPCLLIWTALLWSWETIAQLASIAPHFIMGVLNFQGLWFLGILVCGFVLSPADVVWPLRTLFYIIPYNYAFKAIFKAFWQVAPDYSGAVLCNASDPLAACPLGFTCPNASSLQGCWGVTGDQIQRSAHVVYNGVDVREWDRNRHAPCTRRAVGPLCGFIGTAVLRRAHVRFPSRQPDSDIGFNVSMVILIGVCVKLVYAWRLVVFCRS